MFSQNIVKQSFHLATDGDPSTGLPQPSFVQLMHAFFMIQRWRSSHAKLTVENIFVLENKKEVSQVTHPENHIASYSSLHSKSLSPCLI